MGYTEQSQRLLYNTVCFSLQLFFVSESSMKYTKRQIQMFSIVWKIRGILVNIDSCICVFPIKIICFTSGLGWNKNIVSISSHYLLANIILWGNNNSGANVTDKRYPILVASSCKIVFVYSFLSRKFTCFADWKLPPSRTSKVQHFRIIFT